MYLKKIKIKKVTVPVKPMVTQWSHHCQSSNSAGAFLQTQDLNNQTLLNDLMYTFVNDTSLLVQLIIAP